MTELTNQDLMMINGGWDPSAIGAGLGCIAGGGAVASYIGGSTVLTMGVTAALACGPIGWACVGAVALGAFAGGYLIGQGLVS